MSSKTAFSSSSSLALSLSLFKMASKMLEVCKVFPQPGSPDEIRLPLTFFDLPRLTFPPAELLFFYEAPPYPQSFLSSIFLKLKQSLSLTLQHFLPVAGNLVWPPTSSNPFIHYKKGDGILLTIVHSDADFGHLSSKKIRESEIFRPLVARINGSGSQVPVIAIKITLLSNSGICIGVTVHHCLFDANSITLFMKAWASFTKFGENKNLVPKLTPVFDRLSIREQYSNLENLYIKTLKENGVDKKIWVVPEFVPPPDIVRGTFELSDLDVRKLKEIVCARLANVGKIPYISTFAVAYAYIILCLVKAKGLTSKRVQVMFAFNCRSRLKPPISENYFGNCIGPCASYLYTNDLLGNTGMMAIVNFITKCVKGLDDEALKGAEEWVSDIFKGVGDTETMRIYVSGSNRFEFQSIDFGWGKPRKVDNTSIDGTGGVTFTQGGDGGGIEIDLSLNNSEMERFAHVFTKGLSKIKHTLAAL